MDIHSIGSFGTIPFLNEDLLKQMRNIKSRTGKIAYLLSMGENARAPQVKEGVHDARGALKWISEVLKEGADKE